MAGNLGKVSFSFNKVSVKKPSLNVQPKETVKKIDKIEFIGSIENNSVQLVNAEKVEEKAPLVIPLQHPNLLLQSVIDTVNARKEKTEKEREDATEKQDISTDKNGDSAGETGKSGDNENLRNEVTDEKKETLDEMAARELLEDATKQVTKKPTSNTLTVPLSDQANERKESSLEDYENIPISDFGLAMLRGMGWNPKKGIGKNGKVVTVTGPTVRPKGMGLGADKAIAAQKPVGKNVSEKEVLSKGSKVRITFGQYKNLYATVEGFNDDAGRIDLYMAISNERLSMNECFVQLVTAEEFSKYSKVININAYNNYKDQETTSSNPKSRDREEIVNLENNRTQSPDNYEQKDRKERREKHNSNSHSKHNKSKKYSSDSNSSDSDDEHGKYKKYSSSSKHKSYRKESKRRDSSDSDNYERKRVQSRSNKNESKHSKKYSSGSESSDEKHKSKSKYNSSKKDSRYKDKSPDSDYERKRKYGSSRKKRDRSRSRR